jgi:hypothetical protein
MIQTRVQELVRKGVFQHVKDQPGVVLAGSKRDQNSQAAVTITKKAGEKRGVAPKTASHVGQNGRPQLSLGSLLTNLLAKSQRLVTARELAEQALAQGYVTTSKKFLEVIWVTLGKMDNVVNVPGKGYRLKKR